MMRTEPIDNNTWAYQRVQFRDVFDDVLHLLLRDLNQRAVLGVRQQRPRPFHGHPGVLLQSEGSGVTAS